MMRTQISLTEEERRALDADLADMRGAFGSWEASDTDGATWVERMRPVRRAQEAR